MELANMVPPMDENEEGPFARGDEGLEDLAGLNVGEMDPGPIAAALATEEEGLAEGIESQESAPGIPTMGVPPGAKRLSATTLGFETYLARADNFFLGQRGTGELVGLPELEEPWVYRIDVTQNGEAEEVHIEEYDYRTKQVSNRKPVDEILNLQLFRLEEALARYLLANTPLPYLGMR